MASNKPGKCCAVGLRHEGEPTGKLITIAGNHQAYIATPSPDKAHKDTAILYIPDIFGIWQNSQVLADQFAANGYLCLIVDPFYGDKLPEHLPADFDILKWLIPHTKERVDPVALAGIKTLKEKYGVKSLGAIGYCFGAKYVVRHYTNGIDVGFIGHPSYVDEDELTSITGPLSIAAAEDDFIFTPELRSKSEEILRAVAQPYQINLYSGVEHGFCVRGDPSQKIVRFAKEQAFLQAIAWFDTWLI